MWRPRTCGIDDDWSGRRVRGSWRKFVVLAEVNRGGTDGFEQSSGEMAGIEGVLGKTIDGAVGAVLQRGVGMEGHGDAGELLDVFEEAGVELGAELGERAQGGRMVWVVRGEHAGGGVGGVGERGVALEDQYAGAAGVELQGEREANDAGTGDEDIGCSMSGGGQTCG
jgi:hypothetical protein